MPCYFRDFVSLSFANLLVLIGALASWLHPLGGSQEFCDVLAVAVLIRLLRNIISRPPTP